MNEYDAIVIGVGGMGSAALYHLARRGWRALGLEQFDVPHEMGSSHGYSRMIRYTLQEHPSYVPLVRRAYELWHQLENASRERLLVTTGSIRAGHAEDEYFQGAVAACEEHHIPYEVLTGPETSRRFPGYNFDHDIAAVYQADGGFLLPERCIVNHVNAALEAGAEVHGRERVLDWEPSGEGVVVRTARGSYRAARLVVSAGPWAAKVAPALAQYAVAERQVLGWFPAGKARVVPHGHLPGVRALRRGRAVLRIPGVRCARLQGGALPSPAPDSRPRPARPGRSPGRRGGAAELRRALLPGCRWPGSVSQDLYVHQLARRALHHRPAPRAYPQVSLASGFSGHGFKFASVIGEIMADLAMFGETTHDLALFRLKRFDE